MKSLLVLACAALVTGTASAADHGPVFSFATPVNSQRELSFDTGIFGRSGSQGTQFSTGSGFATASPHTSPSTSSSLPHSGAAISRKAES